MSSESDRTDSGVRHLSDSTWPEVVDRPLVLVPVGSIEQHGPHLPIDTDTVIATATAARAAQALPGAVVAPAICYGASGEHQGFAGTCSIGTEVLTSVLIELVRSTMMWASRIVFVNAHGGNLGALNRAVDQMRSEGHDVAWLACATEDVDLHAGRTETSLMLCLRPEQVRLDRAEAGNTEPLSSILPRMLKDGVVGVSANGVLGDPTGASAEEGARILDELVAGVLRGL